MDGDHYPINMEHSSVEFIDSTAVKWLNSMPFINQTSLIFDWWSSVPYYFAHCDRKRPMASHVSVIDGTHEES